MKYKAAWKCHKCPETNDATGCPCWVEFMVVKDNQEEILKTCIFQALPRFLTEIFKAANRPAAAIESMRNEQSRSMGNLQDALMQAVVMTSANKALSLGRLIKGDFTNASTETHEKSEHF